MVRGKQNDQFYPFSVFEINNHNFNPWTGEGIRFGEGIIIPFLFKQMKKQILLEAHHIEFILKILKFWNEVTELCGDQILIQTVKVNVGKVFF